MKHFTLLIFLSTLSLSCSDTEQKTPEGLNGIMESAKSIPNLQTFAVYHDQGTERIFLRNNNAETYYGVRSVTKSVTATLVGIAIDKGFIGSENETIGQYLEPTTGPLNDRVKNITIAQLLSMTAGASDELVDISSYFDWVAASNQITHSIDYHLTGTPGTFSYNTGQTHMLSAIIKEVSGLSLSEFAEEHLFGPLGIADRPWEVLANELNNGGAGLELTAEDMLKLGQLYLNKGWYQGERIVSERWIEKATSLQVPTNAPFIAPGYGYGWWISETNGYHLFMANGYGGQYIVVIPELRVVVTSTCTWNVPLASANEQAGAVMSLITQRVAPYFAELK